MFCLNYYPFHKYFKQVDQLKIKYNRKDDTLPDFLKQYNNKTIIIDATQGLNQFDLKLFEAIYQENQNFKLVIDYFNENSAFDLIRSLKIPFFFANFVSTVDQMIGLAKYQPTDMYICQELGFSLNKVSSFLHENNIRIRVIPNICQSSFPETPSLKTFFIRPEDIDIYSEYVDVFQIVSDEIRQQVLYNIYKKGVWTGYINEIIPSFKQDIDNRYILNSFGEIRRRCGKRCMYNPKNCLICDRYIDLTSSLEASHAIVRKSSLKE